MRFWGDDRAQSVQIGAVILFGFLIIALSLYQAQVVPTENAEVEFEHSQQLEGEFVDLRNSILSTGRTGDPRSTSIKLGTRYPQRTFFVNPPPASGELSTSEQQTITFEAGNVTGGENVRAFWQNHTIDGNITLPTKSVRYAPDYNEYQDSPEYVYEHSMVAAVFDDAVRTRTGQTVVREDGGQISLTLIDGNLSESGIERRGFDPKVLSQNARSVTLEPEGGEVVFTLPTTVPEGDRRNATAAAWNETFGTGLDRTVAATSDGIRVEIKTTESVELRLSQVGLGSGTEVTNESDGYITKVSNDRAEAGEAITVEVRDRYNNPVEGAEVAVDHADLDDGITNEDGRAMFVLDEDQIEGNSEDVTFSINDGAESWEKVSATFTADEDGGGGGGDGSGAGQGGDSEWSEDANTETISTSGGIWSGIENVNAVVLSNIRLTPISPSEGESAAETRYFRLALTVGDPPEGDRRFTFVIPYEPEGMAFSWNEDDGSFELEDDTVDIVLYEEEAGEEEVVERESSLRGNAIEQLVAGDELNLLDDNIYDDPDTEFVQTLDNAKNHLKNNEDQEVYISDIAGRVDLTLEHRNETMADSTEFVVGSGSRSTEDNAVVEFNLENVGSESVEIVSIGVSDTSDDQADIVRG